MKKVRIGNTIVFRFELTTNGTAVPLDGRDILVVLRDQRGCEMMLPYKVVDGNKVEARWEGKCQKELGTYTIEVWENRCKTEQAVLDFEAVRLVPRSAMVGDAHVSGNIETEETIDLGEKDLAVCVNGNGIKEVLTQQSGVSGGANVVTIVMDNGERKSFSVVNGKDGLPGRDGEPGPPGMTPTIAINADGYWVINGEVTDVLARGEGGIGGTFSVDIGDNKHWIINGVDSGVSAVGPKGDTGATGPAGPQGPQGPVGAGYTLTTADKQTIASLALASANTKQMVVTYEDGNTETINVVVKV